MQNRGPELFERDLSRALAIRSSIIVMLTPRISPLELIWTVCLLPVVRSVRLAANPAASTNTSIWPPPAVPCRLPKMLRLVSLQLPEMRSPWLVTSLVRSNL